MKVEFLMPDGLVIRGVLEGNINASDLVIMLHSGGYTKDERGVKGKDQNGQLIFYNPKGNYEYLSDTLKNEAAILRIDLRNHGESGKNIDVAKLTSKLTEIIPDIPEFTKEKFITLFHQNAKSSLIALAKSLNISKAKEEELLSLIKRPPIIDSSFLTMEKDLEEILKTIGPKYPSYHLVGTCMGGLISTLYIMDHPKKVKSLSLFSPLYTLEDAFIKPNDTNPFSKYKKKTIEETGQFHMGNQVEGLKTYEEISKIIPTFYDRLNNLNIPIYCLQGVEDKLVPEESQTKIFTNLIEYHTTHHLSPVYYATISPGVHCLYDVIYPSILEISTFISSNLTSNLKR